MSGACAGWGESGAWMVAEHDGSFRRLMELVRERQSGPPSGRPGRPPKNRVAVTGHIARHIHQRMTALAQQRARRADHAVSASDLYNEAALQMVGDLHNLLDLSTPKRQNIIVSQTCTPFRPVCRIPSGNRLPKEGRRYESCLLKPLPSRYP